MILTKRREVPHWRIRVQWGPIDGCDCPKIRDMPRRGHIKRGCCTWIKTCYFLPEVTELPLPLSWTWLSHFHKGSLWRSCLSCSCLTSSPTVTTERHRLDGGAPLITGLWVKNGTMSSRYAFEIPCWCDPLYWDLEKGPFRPSKCVKWEFLCPTPTNRQSATFTFLKGKQPRGLVVLLTLMKESTNIGYQPANSTHKRLLLE